MSDWNTQVIEEFRANGGKVAMFGASPVVILHTIGAKSGALREIPLVALVQGDDMTIFASSAGSPQHPDWYYNLLANPEIDIEYGTETFRARVEQLPPDVAAAKLNDQAAIMPQFGEYVTKAAPRVIPAFSITRV
jgi:deazaflavin-dependent oxidoreductase (nitroreductase family)